MSDARVARLHELAEAWNGAQAAANDISARHVYAALEEADRMDRPPMLAPETWGQIRRYKAIADDARRVWTDAVNAARPAHQDGGSDGE